MPKPDFSYEIAISGNKGVGKTSLIFSDDPQLMKENHAFHIKSLKIEEKNVQLKIWDAKEPTNSHRSAKQEPEYKKAKLLCICFSLISKESFSAIKSWLEHALKFADPNVKYVIIGTHGDASEAVREVSQADIQEFLARWATTHPSFNDQINYYEISSTTGKGIKEAFKDMAKQLIAVEPASLSHQGPADAPRRSTPARPGLFTRLLSSLSGSSGEDASAAKEPGQKAKKLQEQIATLQEQLAQARAQITNSETASASTAPRPLMDSSPSEAPPSYEASQQAARDQGLLSGASHTTMLGSARSPRDDARARGHVNEDSHHRKSPAQ